MQGQPGARRYFPSNRIQKIGCYKAQVSLELPVKSAALKVAQRSTQNYWTSWVRWFKSQSSLMSLFDYIIWFCSITKMSHYWEVAVIGGGAPWRCPHVCTVSVKRCWCSEWNGEKAYFQNVSAQAPSWVHSLPEGQRELGTQVGSCRKSSLETAAGLYTLTYTPSQGMH